MSSDASEFIIISLLWMSLVINDDNESVTLNIKESESCRTSTCFPREPEREIEVDCTESWCIYIVICELEFRLKSNIFYINFFILIRQAEKF